MENIFIDTECKCHTTNPDGAFREVALSENAKAFFEGKCTTFIEGYRYCPEDESYVRDDGEVFYGEQITAWKPYSELAAAQAQYETMLSDMDNAYSEGVASA